MCNIREVKQMGVRVLERNIREVEQVGVRVCVRVCVRACMCACACARAHFPLQTAQIISPITVTPLHRIQSTHSPTPTSNEINSVSLPLSLLPSLPFLSLSLSLCVEGNGA